jgi:hypothetical protein
MNKTFSLQFNLSLAGIIASLLWIMVKFGLFNLTVYQWLSICLLIFSLAVFLYFLNEMNDKFLLLSIILFFVSIVFVIYFFKGSSANNRSIFSFDFFYYAFTFSLITFFGIKSFFSDHKLNLFVSIVLLIFTLILIWLFQYLTLIIKSSQVLLLISKSKEILKYIINICLFLLIYFPVKDIVSEIKSRNKQ